MAPKKNRLNSKEFANIIKKGKPYHSNNFFIRIQKNDLGFIRYGVAVSKKLAPRVVQKNYYKRVARHILKEIIGDTGRGYDIVLIVKETADAKNFEELKKEVDELLHKTEIKK